MVGLDVEGCGGEMRGREEKEKGAYRIHDCSEVRLPRKYKTKKIKGEKGNNYAVGGFLTDLGCARAPSQVLWPRFDAAASE